MRTLLKALAILVALWLYAVVRSAGAATLEDSVQSVSVRLFTTKHTECSGTVISKDYILTAGHCLRGSFTLAEIGGPLHICTHLGRPIQSNVQDLALIPISRCGDIRPAEVSDSPLGRGDTFTIIGLSDIVPWSLARGFVMSAEPVQIFYASKSSFMDIPVACQGCDEGDSGSGVFNTKGELAGVFVATSQNNVRGDMVPLADVQAFLREQHI